LVGISSKEGIKPERRWYWTRRRADHNVKLNIRDHVLGNIALG
jgi:hypothetical protein